MRIPIFYNILIDENGIPYCSSSSWEKGMDGEDRNTIQELSKSFRFISAKMEIWPLKVSIILFLKEARTVDNGIIRSH